LTGLRLRLENAVDTIPTDPEAGRAMLAASLEETYRLQRVVDGLLLLSRAEGQSVVPVQTNLADVARSRQEQWELLAEETGVRISMDARTKADTPVVPGAAEQIIDNLIDNAAGPCGIAHPAGGFPR
jgi:signal transduction histidine kinase